MRVMKFKQAYAVGESLSPQHPQMPPGDSGKVITYAVICIPEDVTMAKVLLRLKQTVTFLAEQAGRYVYTYDELGAGVNLR